jgi:hypothetical protein
VCEGAQQGREESSYGRERGVMGSEAFVRLT